MMGKVQTAREALDPVADLSRRLARARGASPSGDVPMAKIRSCVRAWWTDQGLEAHPASVGKRIAIALIEQPMTGDKLAGVLVLQELLGEQLRATDLPAFARMFAAGHLADRDVVDGFSTKVLVTLLDREPGRGDVARVVAQWRAAETIWQRRAACLAFTSLAARGDQALPGLTGLILSVCATVVWSHERLDQTAVGWVLRELSRADPTPVTGFVRRYARLMSKECARSAVDKLPPALRTELLAHHKRATTLGR